MAPSAGLMWGFAGTILLTTLMAGAQGLRLTRMSLPYLLGTMVTPDRDRARVWGIALHLLNGWLFTFLYMGLFRAWGGATPARGALLGLGHAAFVLTVVFPLLPGIHPRMAGEHSGPTVVRQLEPPGFLALHYGTRTAVTVVVAHVIFGWVLGAGLSRP